MTRLSVAETSPLVSPDNMLRYWEMDSFFTCPVVGACLTVSEQRQLLKKACISAKGKTLFELHEILVSCADNENKLSKRVDRLLHRKYLQKSSELMEMNEPVFKEYWKEYFDIGELGLLVYAAAAKQDLSPEAKRELFGIIHMNMHETANVNAELCKELAKVREARSEADEKLKELKQANRALRKESKKLRKSWETMRIELAMAKKERDRLMSELLGLRDDLDELEGQSSVNAEEPDNSSQEHLLLEKIAELEKRNSRLLKNLNHQQKENNILQGLLQSMASNNGQPCDETCPSFDLCRKRVLIVGGISKMKTYYREVVEAKGGQFEYHDGDLRGGIRALEGRFKRADIVLCPVDCNSHAACSVVKKLGRKHNKPVQMLHGSSINAVSWALLEDGPKPS
jgi:hypothetical protein